MKKKLSVCVVLGIQCSLAQAQQASPPSDLTVRGNIASQASDNYRAALASCYRGRPGVMPQGPSYLACLRQMARSESADLETVYAGTSGYLRSSPAKLDRLRQSQRAWLQFQQANCSFARAVAATDSAEEAYLDCIVRSTIDRRTELRALVGD